MASLHLFNPGHETALLFGNVPYTPPANVRKMQLDLALLPLWYAESGDYVLTETTSDLEYINYLPKGLALPILPITPELLAKGNLPQLDIQLWGITHQNIRYFEDLKIKKQCNLNIPLWKQEYRELTSRENAAECLDALRMQLMDYTLPKTPLFCHSIEQLDEEIKKNTPPFVLKTPYSSSGRGLLWISGNSLTGKEKEWINGALSKQGYVSIESGLDKIQDFALEYYIDANGDIAYKGLSIFDTADKGAYTGNRLQAQDKLLESLTQYIDIALFERINKALSVQLKRIFGGIYSGYLGVDMMLYRGEDRNVLLHPCVEINMRNTMGMVAIRLFENYISPASSGAYVISYESNAYENHLLMMEEHPLHIVDGKIIKGYITLCPVTPNTRYRAFILIR